MIHILQQLFEINIAKHILACVSHPLADAIKSDRIYSHVMQYPTDKVSFSEWYIAELEHARAPGKDGYLELVEYYRTQGIELSPWKYCNHDAD